MKKPTLNYAYAIFCDDNDLQRIDATPAIRRKNLVAMARLIVEEIDQIDKASPCVLCTSGYDIFSGPVGPIHYVRINARDVQIRECTAAQSILTTLSGKHHAKA